MFLHGRGLLYVGGIMLSTISWSEFRDANHPSAHSVRKSDPGLVRAIESAGLRDGDVVFRRGVGWISNSVLALDENASYSHVGIVVRAGDSVFVIHVEPKTDTGLGHAVREPITEFLSERKASAAAVYRIPEESRQSAARAARMAMEYANRSAPFDDRFDANTSSAVYCTELVWRAYREAGQDLAPAFGRRAPMLFGSTPLVLISDIQSSRSLRMLVAWPSHSQGKT